MEKHYITTQQDDMIDYLLAGHNISDIAKKLNVARSTIYEWKNKEEIKAELERRREQLKKNAQDRINNDVCTYVDNMKDLACNSPDPRVKLQANKYLLDRVFGSPSVAKESNNSTGEDDSHKDENALKSEIEGIKNLKIVGS